MSVSKFKVGDRVYSPHFGEGIVTGIETNKLFMYPIHVDWTDKKQSESHHSDIFTPEGFYIVGGQNSEMDIVPAEEADAKGFKLMDRVFYPYYGLGTVVADYRSNVLYPIKVKWDNSPLKDNPCSNFTREGRISVPILKDEENLKLMLVKDASPEETEEAADSKFKVGDHVWLNANERGTIVRFCTNEETCIVNSDIEGEVEMRTDALEKIKYSAINPAHYQVEGIPEAIEIMEHLMTKEQMEGFLWGNIIKYAYRYGRKGDNQETAGKIAWYAQKLKEVEK